MQEKLTIGYVTNVYARASDTFIRGEVMQLRAMGHTVHTFSIRRAVEDQHVSEEIRREQATTDYILAHSPLILFAAFALWCLSSPVRTLSTLRLAFRTCPPGIRAAIWQAAYLLEASYLARQARRLRVQHIHNHIATGVGTVTMLAANLANIPYSMTVHGFPEFYEIHKWHLAEKIHRSAFICCISRFCRSQCMAWTPPDDWDKLKIIRCGLDENFLSKAKTPVPDTRRILCISRLSPEKGLPLLLQAATLLAAEGVEFELVVVGDGPMRPEIEAAIKESGLDRIVKITGWASEERVRQHLAESRALVLPSFIEGLPVVLMEAMALGRPVISTWIAGVPELVTHGVSGWLVPPVDANALAQAMREALDATAQQLDEMGRIAAEIVRENHDARNEAAKLAELIRQSIAATGKA